MHTTTSQHLKTLSGCSASLGHLGCWGIRESTPNVRVIGQPFSGGGARPAPWFCRAASLHFCTLSDATWHRPVRGGSLECQCQASSPASTQGSRQGCDPSMWPRESLWSQWKGGRQQGQGHRQERGHQLRASTWVWEASHQYQVSLQMRTAASNRTPATPRDQGPPHAAATDHCGSTTSPQASLHSQVWATDRGARSPTPNTQNEPLETIFTRGREEKATNNSPRVEMTRLAEQNNLHRTYWTEALRMHAGKMDLH